MFYLQHDDCILCPLYITSSLVRTYALLCRELQNYCRASFSDYRNNGSKKGDNVLLQVRGGWETQLQVLRSAPLMMMMMDVDEQFKTKWKRTWRKAISGKLREALVSVCNCYVGGTVMARMMETIKTTKV